MTDGLGTQGIGAVEQNPITVGGMAHELTFLVVNDAPSDLIIGQIGIKSMLASLEFDKDIVAFQSGKKVVLVPLLLDKERVGQGISGEVT